MQGCEKASFWRRNLFDHTETLAVSHQTACHFVLDLKQVGPCNSAYKALFQECHGKGKFKCSLNSDQPVFFKEITNVLFEFLQEETAVGRERTDISLLFFHPAWIILVAARSTSASSCSVKFFNQRVSSRSGRQGLEVAASLRTKKYLGNF